MNNEEKELHSAFEQMETAMGEFANTIASYHEALVKSGIGTELAANLTVEFQKQLLAIILAPFTGDGK